MAGRFSMSPEDLARLSLLSLSEGRCFISLGSGRRQVQFVLPRQNSEVAEDRRLCTGTTYSNMLKPACTGYA